MPIPFSKARFTGFVALLAIAPAFAQTALTWSSTSDTAFSTAANWTGGTAPADSLTTNSAVFDGTGTANPVLTSSQSLQGLSFTGGGYTFSATGGAALTLGAGGITTTAGNHTISTALVLGADQSWSPGSGLQLTASGVISGSGTALTKSGAGTLVLAGNNTYTGTTTISAGTLQIGAAGTTGSVAGDIVNNAALIFNRSDALTYAGVISGSGNFTKTGAGTLTLSGANTYSGTTAVSAGTLQLSGSGTLGATTGGLTVSGGTLDLNSTTQTKGTVTLSSGNITSTGGGGSLSGTSFTLQNGTVSAVLAGSGALTKSLAGTVTLSGVNTFTGTTLITGGTLSINSLAALGTSTDTIAIGMTNRDVALTYTGPTATTSRVINLAGTTGGVTLTGSGTGALTFTSNFTATGAGSKTLVLDGTTAGNTIAGAIVNNSSSNKTSLRKIGTGSWILSGANTYTGSTTVSAGTLQIGAGGTSGSINSTSGVAINPTGTLVFNRSDSLTFDRVISGSGTGGLTQAGTGTLILTGANTFTGVTTVSAGTLQIGSGSTTGAITGNITNNAALIFNRSDALTYAGVISGSGTLTKAGAGTLTLSGASTFTGATTISAGTLHLTNDLALQSSAVNTSGAGVLSFPSGALPTFGGLTGSTNLASVITTGYSTVSELTLNPTSGASHTYSGVIADGVSGMTLTKTGAGTQILSGASTFTGATTISAGTLLINGSLASSSTVSVDSGGTLGGSGTINGATTVSSGGTLAPGTSPGLLTFSSGLTLASGSTSLFEINGSTRGTTFDAVNVAGLTTYGGTLSLAFGTTIANGTTLDLFSLTGGSSGSFDFLTGSGSYTGSFTNDSGTWTLTSGAQLLTFTQSTGDLAFSASAIPEPGTCAALAGLAALGLAVWRRRRAA